MKRFRIFGASLALAVLVIGFSAFTNNSYHGKAFSLRIFQYVGPTTPTSTDVTTPSNYTEITPSTPPVVTPIQRLSGIQFDDATYLVNASNQPDFTNDATLTSEVGVKGLNTANHLATINGIKYWFTKR
jgi:hypothetical protein